MGYTMNGAPFKHTDEHRYSQGEMPGGRTSTKAVNRLTGKLEHAGLDAGSVVAALIGGGSHQNEPSANVDVELTVNGEPVVPKSPMAMRRRRMHGRKRINRTK